MSGDDDESVNESESHCQLQCVLSHFCFESVFYSPGSSLVSFPNPPALVPSEAENLSRSSILFNCDRSSFFCNFIKSIYKFKRVKSYCSWQWWGCWWRNQVVDSVFQIAWLGLLLTQASSILWWTCSQWGCRRWWKLSGPSQLSLHYKPLKRAKWWSQTGRGGFLQIIKPKVVWEEHWLRQRQNWWCDG